MTGPVPPDPQFPRLSTRPFPARRYLPGAGPHPDEGLRGAAHGSPPAVAPDELELALRDWRRSDAFCFGVDLYNFAYWWEAHEGWEALWLAGAVGDPTRALVQGLIQVSAAHLQRFRGVSLGVTKLLGRAERHLALARSGGEVLLGIDHQRWWSEQVVPYFDGVAGAAYPFLLPR